MGTFLIYNWSERHMVSFSEVLLAFAEARHFSLHVKRLECTYNNVTAPQKHLDCSCLSRKIHIQDAMHEPHTIPFPTSVKPYLSHYHRNILFPRAEPLPICME